jgi:hypothetical protein
MENPPEKTVSTKEKEESRIEWTKFMDRTLTEADAVRFLESFQTGTDHDIILPRVNEIGINMFKLSLDPKPNLEEPFWSKPHTDRQWADWFIGNYCTRDENPDEIRLYLTNKLPDPLEKAKYGYSEDNTPYRYAMVPRRDPWTGETHYETSDYKIRYKTHFTRDTVPKTYFSGLKALAFSEGPAKCIEWMIGFSKHVRMIKDCLEGNCTESAYVTVTWRDNFIDPEMFISMLPMPVMGGNMVKPNGMPRFESLNRDRHVINISTIPKLN